MDQVAREGANNLVGRNIKWTLPYRYKDPRKRNKRKPSLVWEGEGHGMCGETG